MLPITAILATVAAVALVGLSLSVSFARMRAGVHIGQGDDPRLLRFIRAQGNFIEYVPMAVIVCALAEYRGAGSGWVWAIAGLVIVGRASHAAGIISGTAALRIVGMICTYGSLLIGAAALALTFA
jgi:uncharacterized protein